MTHIGFGLNVQELDFITKKLGLDKNANQSISLQVKSWLLQSENVTDLETIKEETTGRETKKAE